ncbi:MAG: deoxyribonuclease IV [Gemmatimonadaceae bacterium]
MLLGAHVSTAGGVGSSLPRAKAVGATAMQIFTKQCSQWKEPLIDDATGASFQQSAREISLGSTNAHDSYLINLASPDPALWTRSLISFVCELKRCRALGLDLLVSHPGNYMDDRDSGIARNADAISMALELVPGRTRLLLETTAGTGTALGASFDELAAIIARVPEPERARIGVCVDTCHVFAAGYDLVDDYEAVWARFRDALGMERLGLMHLNDSKTLCGSRRDRHELIGEGSLGEGVFRRIMTDDRLAAIPKVIETPKLDDAERTDRRMLRRLRRFAKG